MRSFQRDDRSGDNRGRDSRTPSKHQAVCSDCGQKCEVPFRPTGDRPVYCAACFSKHGNAGVSRPGGRGFDRPSYDNKRMFEAVCDRCGKKCEVPFRPTGEKPIYCNECFGKGAAAPVRTADLSRDQLAIINSKLDKILQALLPSAVAAPAEKRAVPEPAKPKQEKKATVKAKAAAKKSAAKKKKK